LVFDGRYLHYYINGAWQGRRFAEPHEGLQWKMTAVHLGCDSDQRRLFQGVIDQVRISRVARYSRSFTPVTSLTSDVTTLAMYDFHEGQGETLTDVSGHGHNGMIVGATWVKAKNYDAQPRVTPSPSDTSSEWIDVIPLIDPQADKWDMRLTGKNDWRIEQGKLIAGADEKASKLLLPLDSAWQSFECEVAFTRRSGSGGINLNIPTTVGDCPVVLGPPQSGGLFLGRNGGGVVMNKDVALVTGQPTTLRVEVRHAQQRDHISVWVNDAAAGMWEGNRASISTVANEGYPQARRMSLWVHGGGNEIVFHQIRVKMLDGGTIEELRARPKPARDVDGWVSLFNGQDLTGC
jgi:hypothetical protein